MASCGSGTDYGDALKVISGSMPVIYLHRVGINGFCFQFTCHYTLRNLYKPAIASRLAWEFIDNARIYQHSKTHAIAFKTTQRLADIGGAFQCYQTHDLNIQFSEQQIRRRLKNILYFMVVVQERAALRACGRDVFSICLDQLHIAILYG